MVPDRHGASASHLHEAVCAGVPDDPHLVVAQLNEAGQLWWFGGGVAVVVWWCSCSGVMVWL